MDQVKNSGFKRITEDVDDTIPRTPLEDFVSLIYHFADRTAARELLLLRDTNGIVPTCKSGCPACCKQHILINRPEAHALGQYIRRRFSSAETAALRSRTKLWHHWNDSRAEHAFMFRNRPFCPLLVEGACSAYPVRPMTCRTHFVSSPPSFCGFSRNPAAAPSQPIALTSVLTATNRFSNRLKTGIKKTGTDFTRETMLLPHWLAIEMRWDFAISI